MDESSLAKIELELTQLCADHDRQVARVRDLERQIAELRPGPAELSNRPADAQPACTQEADVQSDDQAAQPPEQLLDGAVERRRLLRGAAIAAGAAGAGMLAAAVEATPAAAANGASIIIGSSGTANSGTSPTELRYGGGATGFNLLTVQSSSYSSSSHPAAIAGFTDGIGVANGVYGYAGTNGQFGVVGVSGADLGEGVRGIALGANGIGVHGKTDSSAGVYGESTNGTGVAGRAATGNGVVGVGDYGFFGRGVRAPLALYSDIGNAPPTRVDAHVKGELVVSDGALWYCTVSGSPGAWQRLAAPGSAGALTILPVPIRVYDSRPGNPPLGGIKAPLGGGTSRVVDCTLGSSGVPVGATAVLVNLTVVNTSPAGFLALYTNGVAYPGTSSINWDHASAVVANSAVSAVDSAAQCQAYVPASSSCDYLVDVIGYFR